MSMEEILILNNSPGTTNALEHSCRKRGRYHPHSMVPGRILSSRSRHDRKCSAGSHLVRPSI